MQQDRFTLKRLGNFYGEDKGTGYAGNVWSKLYLSPALNTAQGGMRETMILDISKEIKYANK